MCISPQFLNKKLKATGYENPMDNIYHRKSDTLFPRIPIKSVATTHPRMPQDLCKVSFVGI